MNIADLQSFLAVVELHSISLAAKKMRVSQPALTNRIKKMEAEWNTRLFVSSGLRTELTQKGKELLPYIRQIIHLNDEMMKSTESELKKPQLLINIGVSIYIAKTIIPPLMMHMNSLGLNYYINTKLIPENEVLKGLHGGEFDIIISPACSDNSVELSSIPLWKEKILTVVGPTHPLTSIEKEHQIAELVNYDAVLMEKTFLIRRVLDEIVAQKKLSLKIISETNVIYKNINLVERGIGWTMIYERLLNPNLTQINLTDCSPNIEFYCYTLKKRMDDRLIRVFIDHLRNWITISNELSNFSL